MRGGCAASRRDASALRKDPAAADTDSRVVRGAIFDIDGVLLDSMGIWEDLGARYLGRCGLAPEPGLGKRLFSMTLSEGAAFLCREYPISLTPAQAEAGLIAQLRQFYEDEVQAKPGAVEYVRWLGSCTAKSALAAPEAHIAPGSCAEAEGRDGCPDARIRFPVQIAAATTGDKELAKSALSRLGILPYFHGIFTCAEAGAGKHEPDVYLAAARAMGLPPKACCVYEDTLYALKTAKRAGFATVGVYDRYSPDDPALLREAADRYIGRGETLMKLADETDR